MKPVLHSPPTDSYRYIDTVQVVAYLHTWEPNESHKVNTTRDKDRNRRKRKGRNGERREAK
jgi:hypothetical protein